MAVGYEYVNDNEVHPNTMMSRSETALCLQNLHRPSRKKKIVGLHHGIKKKIVKTNEADRRQ